jgi:multidrug efflux system outer membrane protein
MRARFLKIFWTAALLALAGCAVGPNYKQPAALKSGPMPQSFAENSATTNNVSWKPAQPAAQLPRGEWWKIFDDEQLNQLELEAASQNQNLAAAVARFDQARALVKVARADLFPQISATPGFSRQRTSVNAPVQGHPAGAAFTYNTFSVPLDAGWELDLFGRVRRQTEAARAQFAASADDLESLKLALQAEVAGDYFTLRALDAERGVVTNSIDTYRRSLELTQNRRKGGIVSDLDVSQAETQLRATEAQLPVIDLQRANVLHALATLAGKPASTFQIPNSEFRTPNSVPALPVGVPSELLQRRPDIASAERHVAAANAEIGVAVSAFYPSIQISGLAGFQTIDAGTLFDWPSRFWSIGPSLTLPLFTGGRNRAELARARAAYDETVANYRQTVLTAFQDVEDQLAAERLLGEQSDAQSAALRSARHTLDIANNRYKAGLVTYLEVATAQSAALQQERAMIQLQGQQLVAEVALIKALGGGWQLGRD